MLHDPTLLVQPEDVDPRPIAVARPLLVAVQHHVITLGKHPLELHPLARIFSRHPGEVLHEALLAVGDRRVVLDVYLADIAVDGLRRVALVEHEIIEGHDRLFVLLLAGHARTPASRRSMTCRSSTEGSLAVTRMPRTQR